MMVDSLLKYNVTRIVGASSQRIDMGNVYNFERTNSWSLSCWVRRDSTAAGHLMDRENSGGAFEGWFFGIAGGGTLIARIGFDAGGGRAERTTAVTSVNNGNWHHLVMTYDGSSTVAGLLIYIDTTAPATSLTFDTLGASILNAASFTLGSRNNADSFWTGDLQDACVFNGVLSAADRTALYNSGNPPDVNSLTLSTGAPRSYWLCGEHKGDLTLTAGITSGTNVPDVGVNGFAGTMVNGPTVVTRL